MQKYTCSSNHQRLNCQKIIGPHEPKTQTVLKIDNLNQAKAELNKIGVHPIGVQIMALKAVYRLVKFEAVDPKVANIIKQEMLSRGGDVAVAETVGKFEETKTDIIIMGTLAQYIRLIRKLNKAIVW